MQYRTVKASENPGVRPTDEAIHYTYKKGYLVEWLEPIPEQQKEQQEEKKTAEEMLNSKLIRLVEKGDYKKIIDAMEEYAEQSLSSLRQQLKEKDELIKILKNTLAEDEKQFQIKLQKIELLEDRIKDLVAGVPSPDGSTVATLGSSAPTQIEQKFYNEIAVKEPFYPLDRKDVAKICARLCMKEIRKAFNAARETTQVDYGLGRTSTDVKAKYIDSDEYEKNIYEI